MNAAIPHDLFSPGRGISPPFLAGREEELKQLDKKMPKADGKPPTRDVILIGPRGNGKTVLLGEFARRCQKAGVDARQITPARIGDKAALVAWLLDPGSGKVEESENAASHLPRALTPLLKSVRNSGARLKTLGIPGMIGIEFSRMDEADRNLTLIHLDRLLLEACRERPRVALIDEAHTLDPEVAALLLNVAQDVSRAGAPFLLVLAGTPQLPSTLRNANSSFWSRCAKIGIGRLTDEAACEALEKPLAEYNVSFEPAALHTVVEESQRYPYFIQLWGEALCEALPEGERAIDASTVDAARRQFQSEKNDYYEERYEELKVRSLLPAAYAAAETFAKRDEGLTLDETFEAEMAQRTGATAAETAAAARKLERLGFIWKPPGGEARHEPGIPSLMNYMLERSAKTRATGAGNE